MSIIWKTFRKFFRGIWNFVFNERVLNLLEISIKLTFKIFLYVYTMKIERKIELYRKKYIIVKNVNTNSHGMKNGLHLTFYYLIRYILLFKLLFHCNILSHIIISF